jgi:hypothetical protein
MGLKPTDQRMERIRLGLAEYYRIYGYMPCPAPLGLAAGAAGYADEDRGGAAENCLGNTISVTGENGGNVLIGAVPVRTLRKLMDCDQDVAGINLPAGLANVFGRRMTRMNEASISGTLSVALAAAGTTVSLADPDGGGPLTGTTNFPARGTVRIGAEEITYTGRTAATLTGAQRGANGTTAAAYAAGVRVVSARENLAVERMRCLYADYMLYRRKNKIVYSVAEAATELSPTPLDASTQEIRIVNANGDDATEKLQPFVLVSMGRDDKGAYDRNGRLSGKLCGARPSDLDNLNCDYADAVFRANPHSTAETAFFDDLVEYSLAGAMTEIDYWNWAAGTDTAGAPVADPNASDTRNLVAPDTGKFIIGDTTSAGTLGATLSALGVSVTLNTATQPAANFPDTGGMIVIDNEKILYASRTGNTLNGLTRGYDGTVVTGHGAGAPIFLFPSEAADRLFIGGGNMKVDAAGGTGGEVTVDRNSHARRFCYPAAQRPPFSGSTECP